MTAESSNFFNSSLTGYLFLKPAVWVGKSCAREFSPLPTEGACKEILYRIVLPILVALAAVPALCLLPIGLMIQGIASCFPAKEPAITFNVTDEQRAKKIAEINKRREERQIQRSVEEEQIVTDHSAPPKEENCEELDSRADLQPSAEMELLFSPLKDLEIELQADFEPIFFDENKREPLMGVRKRVEEKKAVFLEKIAERLKNLCLQVEKHEDIEDLLAFYGDMMNCFNEKVLVPFNGSVPKQRQIESISDPEMRRRASLFLKELAHLGEKTQEAETIQESDERNRALANWDAQEEDYKRQEAFLKILLVHVRFYTNRPISQDMMPDQEWLNCFPFHTRIATRDLEEWAREEKIQDLAEQAKSTKTPKRLLSVLQELSVFSVQQGEEFEAVIPIAFYKKIMPYADENYINEFLVILNDLTVPSISEDGFTLLFAVLTADSSPKFNDSCVAMFPYHVKSCIERTRPIFMASVVEQWKGDPLITKSSFRKPKNFIRFILHSIHEHRFAIFNSYLDILNPYLAPKDQILKITNEEFLIALYQSLLPAELKLKEVEKVVLLQEFEQNMREGKKKLDGFIGIILCLDWNISTFDQLFNQLKMMHEFLSASNIEECETRYPNHLAIAVRAYSVLCTPEGKEYFMQLGVAGAADKPLLLENMVINVARLLHTEPANIEINNDTGQDEFLAEQAQLDQVNNRPPRPEIPQDLGPSYTGK